MVNATSMVAAATLSLIAILLVGSTSPARAQFDSGRQTTPDGEQILVNRSEGGLQWAISYSPSPGTITGNVFDPDGGNPSFVWCQRVGDDGTMNPQTVMIDWACEGSSACTQSPCDATAWDPLGVVPLPGGFFLPARDVFAPLQRPNAYCDPERVGFVIEFVGQPSYEVDTSICHYTSASQPTLAPLNADEDIFVRVWNFALEEPKGASAFFTLMLGNDVIYTEEMPIPKASGLLGPYGVPAGEVGICLRPGIDAPAGTAISFNIQVREDPRAQGAASPTAPASSPDMARPLHSTPGIIHILEMTAGSGCQGEPGGRRLILNDLWQRVSTGLPLTPPGP